MFYQPSRKHSKHTKLNTGCVCHCETRIKKKEVEGEAAFYGPKIDIMAVDAIGREWQISTIQLDFNQPKRFELEYTDKDGGKKIPVMIHRALIGSPDRFLGILI